MALARRVARCLTHLQVPLDVLDDDDRVIHDDADREHQAEEREVVEREAQGDEHGEGADEGNGNRHQRDDGRAPVLEKDDHHQHHEHHGLQHRALYLDDRLLDELGRVVADLALEAGGEACAQRVERGLDRPGGGDRVRAGALRQDDGDGRAPVVEAVGVVVAAAELDVRDVLDAHTRDPANRS
jgi:hypothetical protein